MISTFETLHEEYKSHIDQFKKESGTLENIRFKLGLSRRAICKLLMVDPSAWTRWTKKEGDAPPHIYQALKWYMQLIEKNPDIHAPLKLEQKMELLQKDSALEIQRLRKELQGYMQTPAKEVKEDPKKALEFEILKFDNRKLIDKIAVLETKLSNISQAFEQLTLALKSKAKRKKTKKKGKPKKIPLRSRKKKKLVTKALLKRNRRR